MANGQSFSTAVGNINGTQVAIAAATGFVTSGVSAIYSTAAAAGTTLAVSEVTAQAVAVGTSSVVSQVNDNVSKGQDALNISPVKMVLDIATDHVATNISKGVATTSVATAERQLSRTERIAANDPNSSGRAANVQQAQNKVNGINVANTAKQTAVSSAVSSTASAATVDSGELDPGVPGDVAPPLGSVKNSHAKSVLLFFKSIYLFGFRFTFFFSEILLSVRSGVLRLSVCP